MSIAVGFTGTRAGMSDTQHDALWSTLAELAPTELHHGDCVGADDQADAIARMLRIRVVIHPPTTDTLRAFCSLRRDVDQADVIHPPLPYLERNHAIVDASSVVIAAPSTDDEQLRSGTWATVRYARELGRRVIVLVR